MAKLTEGMVIARTRASDLESVKKLNCWGSEISDVSLLRKMRNVEVLSLSVNNISSLGDFQHCRNLQELYIRKNQIKDLAEICYLKDLTKLRNLWLEDNPCSVGDKYRLTVLRMLPQLQKLDNIAVQPEELRDALLYGMDLTHPDDKKKSQDSLISTTSSSSISPSHHPEADQNLHRNNEKLDNYGNYSESYCPDSDRKLINQQNRSHNEQKNLDSQYQYEMEKRIQQQKEEEKRREYERRVQQQKEEEARREMEKRAQEEQLRRSQTQYDTDNIIICSDSQKEVDLVDDDDDDDEEESNRAGALFGSYPESRHSSTGRPVSSQSEYSAVYQSRPYPVEVYSEAHEENANTRIMTENCHKNYHSNYSSRSMSHDKASPTRPYPVRPKIRNSNILSAVLCLIKELDYASLEVVEVAVRCRMEELDD